MTTENENITDDKRRKRQEHLIDSNIENLAKVLKEMQDAQGAIALEVLEFKIAREQLNNTLQSSIKDSMAILTPALAKTLKVFLEETNINLTESFQSSLKSVRQEAEATVLALKKAREKEKKFYLFKGLMRNGIGLLSAVLVAGGIFYFFPRTQNIRYDMTSAQIEDMLVGKALLDNWSLIGIKDKAALEEILKRDFKKHLHAFENRSGAPKKS